MAADWEKAKREAAALIKKYGFTKPPINPEAIAEAMGVDVVYADFEPGMSEKISGFIRFNHNSMDAPQIVINRAISPARKIFTIAHELGHYILHKAYVQDDARYQVMPRNNVYLNGKPDEEREADCFAANLLVPADMLRVYSSYLGVNGLSTIFAVSGDVILNRKKSLGI